MCEVKVEQLVVPCLKLGEGPHWLQDQQALIFVDVTTKTLRRYFADTGRHQVLHIVNGGTTGKVSFVIPVEGEPDLMVVGLGNTVALVRWSPSDPDTHTTKPITLHTSDDYHFNDAKCDPQGRLWAGTVCPFDVNFKPLEVNIAGLYRFDNKLTQTKWVKNVTLSNGLTWSSDRKSFYYIDSHTKYVYHFDYDDTTGTICNQRVLLDYEAAGLKDQMPDGMTIDVDGNLWVACLGGGQVICVDPREGHVVRQVTLPTSQVTSVCWGGKDYATLYVTTGQIPLSPEKLAASPTAGATFSITGLGTRGSPSISYKIDLKKLKELMKK